MLTYEGLQNENQILYRTLAKQTQKIDKIKEVLKDVNFFNISYKELYDKLLKIYEITEV